MKNSFFTFYKFFALTAILMVVSLAPVFSQGTLDPGNPDSYIDPANTSPLLVGITMLLAYFSGVFPGLKNLNITWIRSAVVAIVVIAGAATFKFGFFTEEAFKYVVSAFLPNFAYSGFIYQALKSLLKLVGVEIESIKPAATA